jgi:hypothetical protein
VAICRPGARGGLATALVDRMPRACRHGHGQHGRRTGAVMLFEPLAIFTDLQSFVYESQYIYKKIYFFK